MKKVLSLACMLCLLLSLFAFSAMADESAVTVPQLTVEPLEIPDNDAMAYLKGLGVGWNLGNTFDAIGNGNITSANEMSLEVAWVQVKTNEKLFDALKAAGFSTVRIPVSWHDHVSGDNKISEKWLNRVQEVVTWAYDRDLHVILNIHHDEDQFRPASDHYDASAAYIRQIWQQLAERFRDYDQRLIFESMNEPRLVGSSYEWYFNARASECADAADCLNRLNQLFVDTVRATGGNNADRYLMVPGYDASPDGALTPLFTLPKDSADNKIIVSVHAYTPYAFALQDGGDTAFTSASQKNDILYFMDKLYKTYIAKGIPVVIGEFGARDKHGNLQDRVNFTAFYTASASARNMPCLWWDNHAFAGNGELFGLINRRKGTFKYPEIVEALITYGGYDKLAAE